MGLRITTWNVNGIRNPFGYAPWNQQRTYEAMFEILEADIVIMQEAKIQRKDLTDDMVLVKGWDVFFSLPRDKKGYSGVAIYTRNSKCCPIRAEEGITGVLCPPKSSTKFRDLPVEQQIGGYPRDDQILGPVDEVMLDSEGRTVILEFPGFVLIGVYVPATRDDTRTDFRIGFLTALDARIRNLVAMGKQVVLAGDLNIIRSDVDTAGCAEHLRKEGMTLDEFMSTPSRRLFNQLVFEGQVIGEKDASREKPVMWDLTRCFHPDRAGMYTCWETKKNARPGNFGSRIDYILCTAGIKSWFKDSDIQEGLIGSDHCPVYATLADRVKHNEKDHWVTDVMNPDDMFKDGQRLREWTTKDLLPQSAKLLNEFDRRRNIKDMFTKRPSTTKTETVAADTTAAESVISADQISNTDETSSTGLAPTVQSPISSTAQSSSNANTLSPTPSRVAASPTAPLKRTVSSAFAQPSKKAKITAAKDKGKIDPNQSSLKGFFKPKIPALSKTEEQQQEGTNVQTAGKIVVAATRASPSPIKRSATNSSQVDGTVGDIGEENDGDDKPGSNGDKVFDPIESKESWSKLLGKKRAAPLCEHEEPCISYQTKKPGVNTGRSFYMCSRPLGPSGQKEKGTQWRCGTFIWQSDWKGT
ncbi:Class II abasic (AP) endonuclease [Gnomoniopsis smithogilvyi]|uniref:DNA-(apurinic or apyrimidinic site) endonuclease 2 n=1 Tax=Gnomoniopsis smithogilvyi TaxID=1191159 RepID=A0A9W9CTH0_9PEZI|nr:Class II abasic (AP) endonuclease [Gnomoniopsis smithogilvyi]